MLVFLHLHLLIESQRRVGRHIARIDDRQSHVIEEEHILTRCVGWQGIHCLAKRISHDAYRPAHAGNRITRSQRVTEAPRTIDRLAHILGHRLQRFLGGQSLHMVKRILQGQRVEDSCYRVGNGDAVLHGSYRVEHILRQLHIAVHLSRGIGHDGIPNEQIIGEQRGVIDDLGSHARDQKDQYDQAGHFLHSNNAETIILFKEQATKGCGGSYSSKP